MFSARKKPKRIARDDPEHDSNDNDEGTSVKHYTSTRSDILFPSRLKADSEPELNNEPVVRRPNLASKSKSQSKLRTSFVPDEAEDSSDTPVIVKPKSRLGRNASTQSLPRFGIDSRNQEDVSNNTLKPSYSKSALEELRNSTPSTPKDLSVYDPSSSGAEDGIRSLDIASKFGVTQQAALLSTGSAIPSAVEIAEKKSRRARLAKEQAAADFIPLEDDNDLYDSDGEFKPRRMQVSTYLRSEDDKEQNTRLIRDDEDVMEGFEDFTEDPESRGRLTMSRHQLQQARRRDRDAMRTLINNAESASSDESDSEAEQNRAYETAQTAHGTDGLFVGGRNSTRQRQQRPRQPRTVTPIPKLAVALGRLRERIAAVELERTRLERRREQIRHERADIKASQDHIQRSLTEAGEELERVQKERERQNQTDDQKVSRERDRDRDRDRDRGLDTIGQFTPEPT